MLTRLIHGWGTRQGNRQIDVRWREQAERSPGRLSGNACAIALMGHSATGKSTLLQALELDRYYHDMDVFCRYNKHLLPHQALEKMLGHLSEPRIIALRNDADFLQDLVSTDANTPVAGCLFVYLRRPYHVVRTNRAKMNADGLIHKGQMSAMAYRIAEHRYRAVADLEINYRGSDIRDLADCLLGVSRDYTRAPMERGRSGNREHHNLLWSLDRPLKKGAPDTTPRSSIRIAGWAVSRTGEPVRLLLEQGGQTASYPLTVERPDVVDALQATNATVNETLAHGFDMRVKKHGGVRIGFEHGEYRTWVAEIDAHGRHVEPSTSNNE